MILSIAVPVPLRKSLDYLAPKHLQADELKPGVRVRVPFGRRELIGVLLEIKTQSDVARNKLKPIIEILDEQPVIPVEILNLLQWASDYYQHPIGDVVACALPTLLRQGKPATLKTQTQYSLSAEGLSIDLATLKRAPAQQEATVLLRDYSEGVTTAMAKGLGIQTTTLNRLIEKNLVQKHEVTPHISSSYQINPGPKLNDEQQQAVNTMTPNLQQFQCFLINGITGSGKTEVYFSIIEKLLKDNMQVLVLVPEIALTPQTVTRFHHRFQCEIALLHSGLNDRERLDAWLYAKHQYANIIIGTRSAIFTPIPNLGAIIIDEEHDSSYKQHDGFRYHARDVATMRAHNLNIPIILGSATPSLESLYNCRQQRFKEIHLTKRAGNAKLPPFYVIDIRNQYLDNGISNKLFSVIEQHLKNNNQVLLFINRRGFAPSLICHHCGAVAQCLRCDSPMVLHQSSQRLHCHHCSAMRAIPKTCSLCHSNELVPVGLGTQRIEQALNERFPNVSIARIDRDNIKTKNALDEHLNAIHDGTHQILVGTQMLAKGHHFPNVSLVAILDVDGGFFAGDPRAEEQLGQLIMQVAGRAGRADKPGEVWLQTRHPNHPSLASLIEHDYQHFSEELLEQRKQAHWPPYGYIALLRAQAHEELLPMQYLQQIQKWSQGFKHEVEILGPIPAPMARKAGRYRAHLLIKANDRKSRHRFLRYLLQYLEQNSNRKLRWSLDVDPMDLA